MGIAACLPCIAGCTALLAVVLAIFLKYKHTFWARKGVFSPPSNLIFGHFKEAIQIIHPVPVLVKKFYDKYKPLGHKFIGLYALHSPMLAVFDPALIKTMFTKDFEYLTDRNIYHNEESDPLSAHLFNLTGMKWKKLRQKLTPTFTSGKLKQMFPTLLECSNALDSCLNEQVAKGEPIEIKKYMVQYTTDIIGSCAFGIDCNSFKNPDSEFIKYGRKIFTLSVFDRFKFFFANLCPNFAKYIKLRVTNSGIHNFFMGLVKDTVEYREQKNVTRNDFLQLLLQLKNKGKVDGDDKPVGDDTKLTLDQVAAQVFIFFLAGFETSSSTLTFCLYEISKDLEIQKKMRKEIINVLAMNDGNITYDALMNMPYIERVIQETLRKHSPVMMLRRQITKDYVIPDTNIELKKGLGVAVPIMALHYDEEYYPDPEKFDPDRFTDEAKQTRPDFTWLPFGDGPRICIGMRFGMMETKVALCRLLLNYKFTLNPKTVEPLEMDPLTFVKSVKEGVWLNAERI